MRTHLAASNGLRDMLWRKCCGFWKNTCGFASVQCFQNVFCTMPSSLEYAKSVIKSHVWSSMFCGFLKWQLVSSIFLSSRLSYTHHLVSPWRSQSLKLFSELAQTLLTNWMFFYSKGRLGRIGIFARAMGTTWAKWHLWEGQQDAKWHFLQ